MRSGAKSRTFRRAAGFTVIELIVAVILLSVLGVSAVSRFVQPSAFAPAIVAETLVAQVRFAQQLAAARRDAAVSFVLDRHGGDWRFQVATSVDGVVRTERVEAENTTVHATSGALADTVDAGNPLILQFSHAGDLSGVVVGASAGAPTLGVDLRVDGDSARAACVYPTGYASAAACI